MIQRKARQVDPKRQVADLIEKHKKIGELLKLEKVPLHVLAWKEPRYELGDGDCYPLVDVIERLAELVATKPGRPKKG